VREEVAQSREELSKAGKEQRQDLSGAFRLFGDSFAQRMMDVASTQKAQLDVFSDQLISFTKLSAESLDGSRVESAASAKQLREEVVATLTTLSETMTGHPIRYIDTVFVCYGQMKSPEVGLEHGLCLEKIRTILSAE
jgi:DNA recombination protein RmuC